MIHEPHELAPAIEAYYALGGERLRLTAGSARLELLRTRDILARYMPPSPSTVLDVGGAAGAYGLPLASQGYRVHLVDPVPLHIAQAKAASLAQPTAPLASATVGDARSLDWGDGSVDAVLLMGPLYHLTDRGERTAALAEARRVLRTGGTVIATVVSRFASTIDGLRHNRFAEPGFEDIQERDLIDGQHRNPVGIPDWFTTAYLHRPEELRAELEEAQLTVDAVVGVEGPGWLLGDLDDWLSDPQRRDKLLAVLRRIEAEPSIMGVSAHLLAVGHRR